MERRRRGDRGRQRSKRIFRVDGNDFLDRNFHDTSRNLQSVFVSDKLITRYMNPLAAPQGDVLCAQTRRCREQNRARYERAHQAHGAASRNAKCSIAAATPPSSLLAVSCQPNPFNSATPFPITTGMPANVSISRSLRLSPMTRTSSRDTPRKAAHSASEAPFEQTGLITSIIEKFLLS